MFNITGTRPFPGETVHSDYKNTKINSIAPCFAIAQSTYNMHILLIICIKSRIIRKLSTPYKKLCDHESLKSVFNRKRET